MSHAILLSAVTPILCFLERGVLMKSELLTKELTDTGDPFGFFTELITHAPMTGTQENLPPFLGGAVGFFSYDLVRQFEILPQLAVDDLQLPDLQFLFVEALAAIDHETKMLHLIFSPAPQRLLSESRDSLYREGQHRLAELRARLENPSQWSRKNLPNDLRDQYSRSAIANRIYGSRESLSGVDCGR